MAYVVLVTRPTEDPANPEHRFRMTDERRTFGGRAEAERAREGHLAAFPADRAEVMPAGEAGGR